MDKMLHVTMPDGSVWGVPVYIIARNRAEHYSHEFDFDVERSLQEDTLPAFEDDYEITDWAEGHMNWEDVEKYAFLVKPAPTDSDFQEGWCNGDKEVV